MRHNLATPSPFGVFAPVLSLDALVGQRDADDDGPAFDLPDTETLPLDEQIARAQGFAALDRFVADLPDRDQMIVRRMFWQGHTQTQIAADLGVSKMAISKAFARICKVGRTALTPHQHIAFMN